MAVVLSSYYGSATPANKGLVFYETIKIFKKPSTQYQIEAYKVKDKSNVEWTVFARDPNTGYVLAESTIDGIIVVVVASIVLGALIFIGPEVAAGAAVAALVGDSLNLRPSQTTYY